jgi:tetratricopeptide (TPR) repeat protein
MKMLHARTSLYLASLAAISLTLASPHMALAKKAEAPAGQSKELNEDVQPFMVAAQEAFTKKDYKATMVQVEKAEPKAKSPYEHFLLGVWRAQCGQNLNDTANFTAGLDEVADSGFKDETVTKFAVFSAKTAYGAKDYAKAIKRAQQAQAMGSTDADLPIIVLESYRLNKDYPNLISAVQKQIEADTAAHVKTQEAFYSNAAQAELEQKHYPEMVAWLEKLVVAYPSANNWHDLLNNYIQTHKGLKQHSIVDIYRLMRATKSFRAHQEVLEYAETVGEPPIGLPGEAASAIQEAETNGVIKNPSATITDVLKKAQAKIPADKASLKMNTATYKSARGNGDGYFSYGDYANALTLYSAALDKAKLAGAVVTPVEIAELNMRVGITKALLGDKAGAVANLDAVTGDEADVARFWKDFINQ